MAHVLFVCLHNAARSQMSEALFAQAADGRHSAESAGTAPAERVHPQVVEVMREVGLDLADRTPRKLDREGVRGPGAAALPPEVTARLERMEQAIESIAIEVERISEGQRFTTKLLAERTAPSSGPGIAPPGT